MRLAKDQGFIRKEGFGSHVLPRKNNCNYAEWVIPRGSEFTCIAGVLGLPCTGQAREN